MKRVGYRIPCGVLAGLLGAACGAACGSAPHADPQSDASFGPDASSADARADMTTPLSPAKLAGERQVPFSELILLGDSNAGGFGTARGDRYVDLLVANDDVRYPAAAGRDLRTLDTKIQVFDLSVAGGTSAFALGQLARLRPNTTGRSAVIISIGGGEYLRQLDRIQTPAGLVEVVQERNDNLRRIGAFFADQQRYPHGVVLGHLLTIDPTDGVGALPEAFLLQTDGVCRFYSDFVKLGLLTPHNALNAAAATDTGMINLDLHALFLGHAYLHSDSTGPHYRANDPTQWMSDADCIHPNELGQLNVRRLIWNELIVPHCAAASCRALPAGTLSYVPLTPRN